MSTTELFRIVVEFGDGSKAERSHYGIARARVAYKNAVRRACRMGGIVRIFDAAGADAIGRVYPQFGGGVKGKIREASLI